MILIDSSVWIDYFQGRATPRTKTLDSLLGTMPIATGDPILAEVLQGFATDRDFNQARRLMAWLVHIGPAGHATAIQAARNVRILRTLGIAVRKTIDTLIATRGFERRPAPLWSDKELDPFVAHVGLRSAPPER